MDRTQNYNIKKKNGHKRGNQRRGQGRKGGKENKKKRGGGPSLERDTKPPGHKLTLVTTQAKGVFVNAQTKKGPITQSMGKPQSKANGVCPPEDQQESSPGSYSRALQKKEYKVKRPNGGRKKRERKVVTRSDKKKDQS